MGLFDWRSGSRARPEQPVMAASDDEQAIARYRYLLKTAPPEAIEQAHAEAFAQLTPEQRRMVLEQLGADAPHTERARVEANGANAQDLARLATRAEMRRPGTLERAFGGAAMPGFGGMMAGSLLGSVAGTVLGSMIAREFFTHDQHFGDVDHAATGDHVASEDQHDVLADDASSDAGLGGDTDFGGFDDGGTFDV